MKVFNNFVLLLLVCCFQLSWGNISEKSTYYGEMVQSYGVITGTVFGEAENPLPGTSVFIRDLNLGTVTNLEGRFSLRNVPVGLHKLEIIYIGAVSQAIEVEVKADESVDLGIIVLKEEVNELGEVVVTASIEGQQRAYNQQKNSDQIKTIVSADLINQFPDINVAEALQRVSGVNIERELGEGTNIRIRGTPSNYTTISIDGAQLPNTDGDTRTESLDLIPAELLATMEITKALLPENDGDAIGGAVNLKTPTATSRKGKLKGSVAGGYADINERGTFRSKLKYNKRFLDKKFGVILGASYYTINSGEERINGLWQRVNSGIGDDEELIEALSEVQVRPTTNLRERIGSNVTLDYKFSENSEIFLTASYNYLRDRNFRYRTRYRSRQQFPEAGNPLLAGFPNGRGRLQKDIADQDRKRNNFTLTVGGNHLINKKNKLDYGANFSDSRRNETAIRSVFARNGLQFDIDLSDSNFPQYNPFLVNSDGQRVPFDESDASEYGFLGYQIENPIEVLGTNISTFINYEIPFRIGEKINSKLKFGTKVRLQENSRRRNNVQYQPYLGNFTLDQVAGPDQGDILDGRYTLGLFPSASRMERHFDLNSDLYVFDRDESIFNALTNTYDAQEDIFAAYVQDKLDFGKFSAVFGVRYEITAASYQSNFVERAAESITTTPIEGNLTYDFLLPSVSTKYALNRRTNIRLSYFQSFARPNFEALIPGEIVNFASQTVRRGNPELNPAFSNNLDFMIEHYFKKDGTVTFGVYYKNIENFIFQQRRFVTDNPLLENFQLLQFINGDVADVLGVEVTVAKKFTFLPGFLSNFGAYANYTYVNSSSSFTGERFNEETGENELVTREDVPFVGQADHTWNAALYYDQGKFNIRASLNYNGSSFTSYDVDPFFDFILEERYQLDANASYKINDNLSVFLEAQNLLDSPVIEYQRDRNRMSEYRIFGTFARLGLKFKF
jgi:TonB-dependent receptor